MRLSSVRVIALLLLTGCGGAAVPASSAPASGPGDLSAASADLDRAEQDVLAALSPGGSGAVAADKSAAPAAPAPGGAPAAASPPPAQAEAAPTGGATSSGGGCGAACRALASMERASEHLCALTSDSRCENARTRVKNASERVHAGCPACSS